LLAEPLGTAARSAVEVIRRASRGAALVSLDLASVGPITAIGMRAAERLVAAVDPDVLFGNAAEVALFGARAWPARLLELVPVVIVKQGAAGCEVLFRAPGQPGRFTVATRALAVTDATGAGDAFDAGFLMSVLSARVVVSELSAVQLRSAAVAGNRAAGKLLGSRRPELGW
jgi:sugar/nucleoside kinase (ribokinase family)